MTEPIYSDFDNGLRILARMIARVYLKDLAAKHAAEVQGKVDSSLHSKPQCPTEVKIENEPKI